MKAKKHGDRFKIYDKNRVSYSFMAIDAPDSLDGENHCRGCFFEHTLHCVRNSTLVGFAPSSIPDCVENNVIFISTCKK